MIDLERYAEIAAALANADDRARVFADHGITEDQWEIIDEVWQSRLSEALESFDEDGVPELVASFSTAYDRAKAKHADVEPMPLDQFAELTRAIQRSQNIPHTLTTHGVTFAQYTRANQYWMARIAKDPALGETLRKTLT
jgi:hypothetical protein